MYSCIHVFAPVRSCALLFAPVAYSSRLFQPKRFSSIRPPSFPKLHYTHASITPPLSHAPRISFVAKTPHPLHRTKQKLLALPDFLISVTLIFRYITPPLTLILYCTSPHYLSITPAPPQNLNYHRNFQHPPLVPSAEPTVLYHLSPTLDYPAVGFPQSTALPCPPPPFITTSTSPPFFTPHSPLFRVPLSCPHCLTE